MRREAEGLFSGRAFLGRVVVRIPQPGAPPERGWFELRAGEGGKHAEELAARCRRAGRATGELGELRLSVETVSSSSRDDARGDSIERASPRTPHTPEAEASRRRAAAAATPPTPQSYDEPERHGLAARVAHAPLAALRHARDVLTGGGGEEEPRADAEAEASSSLRRGSASHRGREATHVHVAVVAARGLLPSDFPAPGEEGETEGSGPSSDPYVAVRLLPALPEERHVTRVVAHTLDPLWEVRGSIRPRVCWYAAHLASFLNAGGAHLSARARLLRRRNQGMTMRINCAQLL